MNLGQQWLGRALEHSHDEKVDETVFEKQVHERGTAMIQEQQLISRQSQDNEIDTNSVNYHCCQTPGVGCGETSVSGNFKASKVGHSFRLEVSKVRAT